MQIVHFGHACVLIDTGSARLLIDPGTFASGFESVTDLDAVLITHQHFDHLDLERLPTLLAANPDAELIIDPGSEDEIIDHQLTARTVRPGETLELGGARVEVVGGDHAVIHPDYPIVPNVGYLVDDGAFYHPGDSLFLPQQRIDVLGLPAGAPWLKTGEAIEFQRSVNPRVSVPIHEALLSDVGRKGTYAWFERLAPKGTSVRPLETAIPVEV
ncbi:L-ascorbate metabolism protein UlaG (beta-lactamase superfamily) [Herbihabitans rhizosphaerae]|uniref:L-ascorbate metabolism protein UlaG (Beta-lactamase superfamily) n=1 Tax=Herbihabitans rhizosphaerae TaxID=1872711 RepID=A0A4Q7L052_9PSEU|nr:MBL fold metallo-hydrolase [Herbihabitans rhizosphaerae]RZS41382.1 L-ascorbate metabolism protein UlaG (beta-lactamase superfamily) [Herbihabitans rhizosphaerae]